MGPNILAQHPQWRQNREIYMPKEHADDTISRRK